MSIVIKNNNYQDWVSAEIKDPISIQLTADEYLDKKAEELEKYFTAPLYNTSGATTIIEIDGEQTTAKDLALRFAQKFAEDIMVADEDDKLSEVMWQAGRYLTSNNKPLNFQIIQSILNKYKLPAPSSQGMIVKYIPKDCVMSAKDLVQDFSDQGARELFSGNLGAYFDGTMPATVLAFKNEDAFEDFKNEVLNQQTMLAQHISPENNKLLADFLNITLSELAEGIIIRLPEHVLNDEHDSNQEYSFLRVLENAIKIHLKNSDNSYEIPVQLSESYFMCNLFMVNVENIAHASDEEFKKSMRLHAKGFNQARKLKIVSNKALKKAEKVARANQPAGQKAKTTRSNAIQRAARRKFRDKPATSKELLAMISKVIDNRTTSQMTSNTYTQVKPTFMRPNRRDPNNINLLGKMKTVKYRPDIHIYIDTSGSITEGMYRDAVGTLIYLAKKLDVNLYVTSFSHIISQTAKLEVQGRKVSEIYKDFIKIDKVSGGTDYTLVWDKITTIDALNRKNNKSYQINFMLTDFEYYPPSRRVFTAGMPSVKNMYYLPMSVSSSEYEYMKKSAEEFANSMVRLGDTNIRNRILLP